MPTSSAVTCRLNSKFEEAVKNTRFYRGRHSERGFYGSYQVELLKDKEHPRQKGPRFKLPGMACCGLEELDFQGLQEFWEKYKDNDVDFLNWVAKYIRECIEEDDNRVLIVGIPVKVGNNTMYNIEFYTKLRSTLEEMGFVQMGKPYVNQNSKNTIVALVGQLPK